MTFALKPTHKAFKDYVASLAKCQELGAGNEGAVKTAFSRLLNHCGRPFGWTLLEEQTLEGIRVDGVFVDDFRIHQGYWEAKDDADDLVGEIHKKFKKGYPASNILFQSPSRLSLWQNGREVVARDHPTPEQLIDILREFFEFRPPAIAEWRTAVEEFKGRVPELAGRLIELIERERTTNRGFRSALGDFTQLCRESINPNISDAAVEEMLIQHLLTERIFRKVFNNPEFTRRNVIAREIEKVIDALASRHFSREEFLSDLDRFYRAIETTASRIEDFSQKQDFLNTVYEKFFQGFSVKVADTHGIVYTPQPIVDFMVRSVDEILRTEFGRSLDSEGVHILDPFVGTGNFILRVMRHMPKTRLPRKYRNELHCNEVMLLPYYIASMNIEHEYFALTGSYEPFEGICLVDTFDLTENRAPGLFTPENTKRVHRQKDAPIFVIVANPPYNAGQVNENDNNKNRRYEEIDRRIKETYQAASNAKLSSKLYDPYVRAFRWASDRIGDQGVIAYVSNGSFGEDFSFDGFRECLSKEFQYIDIVDLGGNVRKNPKLSGTKHNVFGIQVSVCITFLIKKKNARSTKIRRFFLETDWTRARKLEWLNSVESVARLSWKKQTVASFRDGIAVENGRYLACPPIGRRDGNDDIKTVFRTFSHGLHTGRDLWVTNFRDDALRKNLRVFRKHYESALQRWDRATKSERGHIDDFVDYDDRGLKWSATLKAHLKSGALPESNADGVRHILYRPFTKKLITTQKLWIDRVGAVENVFPVLRKNQNVAIVVSDRTSRAPFSVLATDIALDHHVLAPSDTFQYFPFRTFNDEDSGDGLENITDWALAEFRSHYGDKKIKKWDIFYYIYALLHHPSYRKKYEANLKRELPRIPFAPDFRAFAKAGKRLAEIHVEYEAQPEYPLEFVETPGARRDLRVEKMRLSRDRTEIAYNDFLTLRGIPARAFEYRLGHKSALDWVLDQYQVTTDKRSGIVNDPNREDDDEYIVRLIAKVITVSLETVDIVESLPAEFEAVD